MTLACCCLVSKSRPAFCSPMDCSTPGLPVLHCLPEFAQTHVHWVCDTIQPSHSLSPPSLPLYLHHYQTLSCHLSVYRLSSNRTQSQNEPEVLARGVYGLRSLQSPDAEPSRKDSHLIQAMPLSCMAHFLKGLRILGNSVMFQWWGKHSMTNCNQMLREPTMAELSLNTGSPCLSSQFPRRHPRERP